MHPPSPTLHRSQHGFTIIELMIAVVVLGVIVAIALPSFLDSIRKGRRSEALSAISAIQQAQERYRGNNRNYAGALTDFVGSASVSASTRPGGYYIVQVSTDSATSATRYVATADGSGSGQADDGQCAKLGVQVDGGVIQYASCKSCSITAFTFAPTDPCWSR